MTSVYQASILPSWMDPQHLLGSMGAWATLGICLILFAECGLLIGFFLPGDTLLFFAGIFHASGAISEPLWVLLLAMGLSAFIGNMVGYAIGYKLGPAVFKRPDARFLKPEYIEKSSKMFDKYGKPAVVLARFVPVVRTIAPVMAGASKMNVRVYTIYSAIGGVLWTILVTYLGIWLGQIAFIRDHLDLIIVAAVVVVVLFSVAPAIVHWRSRRRARRAGETAENA